jgi:hypothetical protein
MAGASLCEHLLEGLGPVAPAVIGQHPFHLDPEPGEPGQRSGAADDAPTTL